MAKTLIIGVVVLLGLMLPGHLLLRVNLLTFSTTFRVVLETPSFRISER